MSRKKWVYEEGIVLLEETSSTATKGAISTKAADEKLHVYLDGADRSVLTEDQTQTVTNKSVDADNNTISNLEVDNLKSGVLNTSTTLAGASNTQLPSALAVKTYVDDKTAAQNEASEISYDNAVSGLSATNVQDAIDEVDANVNTVQSNLTAHIDNTTDAHDASAISNVPAGTISSTNVQSAINELDGDIQAHINDTTDAHDASAISTTPISGVTGTDVQAMLSDLKTQIDTKGTGNGDVSGAISSTDNAIARFDGTTGKIIQNSTVTLSDTGVVAGLSLDADTNTVTNIEDADIKVGANIARAKLASGTANAVVHNDASGVMSNSSDLTVSANGLVLGTTKHLETQAQTDSTTTGANASLASFTAGVVRLTNNSLSSLANIPAGANGQQLIVINRTGVDVTVVDSSGAVGTASNRIFTGTNATITFKNNSALVLSYDSTSARWQIIGGTGSGDGAGVPNYISNGNFEVNANGWATYADTAGTNPVDGTGGTANITLARSATSPLFGTASGLLTKDAVNRQGQGFSYDFTIDNGDKGKVLQIQFSYQIASGTFADNDMSVWVYDVTNGRLIQPAPYLIKNSTIIEYMGMEFQSNIDSTSYRLIFHIGSTSALAYSIRFDNIIVSNSAKLYGSATTGWELVTSGASVNWTNSTLTLYKRRVGDSVEYQGRISFTGTPVGGALQVTLPHSYDSRVVGGFYNNSAYLVDSSANQDYTLYNGPTSVNVTSFFRLGNAPPTMGSYGSVQVNSPIVITSGDSITFNIIPLPVQGWSSSQVMSSDADTRVVFAKYATNSAKTSTSSQPFDYEIKVEDTHNAVTTGSAWKFTAPVPGYYRVSAGIVASSAASANNLYLYKNGSGVPNGGAFAQQLTTNVVAKATNTIFLKAGEYIDLRNGSGSTATLAADSGVNAIEIERISGPSQIMASESVSALYTGAPPTGTLTASYNKVTFGTKIKDSHAGYVSGVYTIPVSGCYDIESQVRINGTYASNAFSRLAIYINGVDIIYSPANIATGATATYQMPKVSVKCYPMLAGTTVEIRAYTDATGVSFSSASQENNFSINRSGNY
jgi:hypothetical protein